MDDEINNVREEPIGEALAKARKRWMTLRRWEWVIWIVIAAYSSLQFWVRFFGFLLFRGGNLFERVLDAIMYGLFDAYNELLAGLGFLLFPFLFLRIFGELPLSLLARRFRSSDLAALQVDAGGGSVNIGSISLGRATPTPEAIEAGISLEEIRRLDPRALLAFYSERTHELTRKIYSRAGVYLLVGVMIAFVGLAFFYMRSKDMIVAAEASSSGPLLGREMERIIALLPGFGILFFIEFIAFFFLRQYRTAMDEFRYFDAIRRGSGRESSHPKDVRRECNGSCHKRSALFNEYVFDCRQVDQRRDD